MASSQAITLEDFILARKDAQGIGGFDLDIRERIGAVKDMRHAAIVLGLDTGKVHGPAAPVKATQDREA